MSHIRVPMDFLVQFMRETLKRVGVPEQDAGIVTDVLIRSDLRGIESHGIGRFKMYLDFIRLGVQKPVTKLEIVRESPGTALVDGHYGMGHVISHRSMQIAIDKAEKTGIAAVAVRNSTHFGICGYYPLMAVERDMAGLAFTNARPSIAPTFGLNPMLGTNPIAFAAPTDEECPFVLDMATSIAQRGKIEVLARKGENVPEGWAIDSDGNIVLDAEALLSRLPAGTASLCPLGGVGEILAGYKGYGLAMMVEILSAAFSGGPFCWGLSGFDESGQPVPNRLGHFFIAINIAHFIDPGQFKKITGDLVRAMRESAANERIYTAGEKEFDKEGQVPGLGVPLNERLCQTLRDIKREYEIDLPLPF